MIGFVVAGGRSARMGRDKADLPWGSATLLDHALARLREVCREVRVLCGPAPRYADRGVPIVLDAPRGAGPLAALVAALAGLAPDELGLFLAVDLPLVPISLLRALSEAATGHDVVVPVTAPGPHPLCAAYRAACLEPARRRLAAGELRMTSFWPDVRVRTLDETALSAHGEPDEILRNVNTPADYGMATGTSMSADPRRHQPSRFEQKK